MRELEFRIDCLDGKYCFKCEWDKEITYKVDTDIEGLNSLEGKLEYPYNNEFVMLIKEAKIENWERNYSGDQLIEDGIKWSLRYLEDNEEYLCEGEESYEPYQFKKLIEAVKVCDKQQEYFGW